MKQLDPARCASATADLESIAKAAKKTCATTADCTEWIRPGNCGSVALARPFPPADSEVRFNTAISSVNVACPADAKCKWASMGVECRGGVCGPSLDGVIAPEQK